MSGSPARGRVIDLTLPMTSGMWRYGEAFPGLTAEPATSLEHDGFEVTRLGLGTHLGTHTDAESHLRHGGWRLGDLPIETYIGPARILRVTDAGPLEPIGEGHLARAGTLERGAVAIVHTGWDRMLGSPSYATSHPYLTLGAADALLDAGIRLVAADLPGLMDPRIDLAPGARPPDTVDERLLRHRVPYVVGLVNVGVIDGDECWFSALPLRLDGLDGSPVRAAAIESP